MENLEKIATENAEEIIIKGKKQKIIDALDKYTQDLIDISKGKLPKVDYNNENN